MKLNDPIINLAAVLQHLFPDAVNGVDYALFDDGCGTAEIRTELHLPTQAQLLKISKRLMLQSALAGRLADINAECERLTASVRAATPQDEVQSWGKQESEALALIADAGAVTPLLSAIASARGIPLVLLAKKIIEKSNAYASFTGQLIGTRQALEDRLLAIDVTAGDAAEQIEAVQWPEQEPESAS